MNVRRTYTQELENLVKAIDIAIESYQNFPPKLWNENHIKIVTYQLMEEKSTVIHAEPKFRNLSSLKYSIKTVFTYFQEASGPAVEHFWNKIEEAKLGYKRINHLEKILERGKIKNRIEFEYVTDMVVSAQQLKMITQHEAQNLKFMLGEFEKRKK